MAVFYSHLGIRVYDPFPFVCVFFYFYPNFAIFITITSKRKRILV